MPVRKQHQPDWVDFVGFMGMMTVARGEAARRQIARAPFEEVIALIFFAVGGTIVASSLLLRYRYPRKWVEVPDDSPELWTKLRRAAWVDWIGISGILCCVVAMIASEGELNSFWFTIGVVGLFACVAWFPLRLSYFSSVRRVGDPSSPKSETREPSPKQPHRQLTGSTCRLCDRPICGDIEGEFCPTCGSPVHFRCVNPASGQELPSRCSRCGADPNKALAADYSGG